MGAVQNAMANDGAKENIKQLKIAIMKKGLKYCLILLVTIIGIIFINGCYYVFYGQEKSMKKLQQGKELNLYECCSIYSMHMAVWMFGWTFAPEAAKEYFFLHLPYTQGDTIDFKVNKITNSRKINTAINSLVSKPIGSSVYVTWDGNKDYALSSPEHRAAIAINPCKVTKIDTPKWMVEYSLNVNYIEITSPMIYPKYSRTTFDLGKFKIVIHEGLFRYLQDKGWLTKYTDRYKVVNLILPVVD